MMVTLPNFTLHVYAFVKATSALILFLLTQVAFSQNVGINTLSPIQKLHVKGSIAIDSGRLSFINTGNSVFIGEDAGLNDNLLTPHHNTFIGFKTGQLNVTGADNTAIGSGALFSGTNSSSNVAIGKQALFNNNSSQNIAIGIQAGFLNTGTSNVIIGSSAGYNNTGDGNIFLGQAAGAISSGSDKLYIDNTNTNSPLLYGEFDKNRLTINDTLITKSLRINSGKLSFINTGQSVFIGEDAGKADDLSINKNVFVGYRAGIRNMTGESNIAIGHAAMDSSVSSSFNTAIGTDALGSSGLSGGRNTAIGHEALKSVTTGGFNVGLGSGSMKLVTTGSDNVALGTATLFDNKTGIGNVAIGKNALTYQTSGSYNTSVGTESGGSIGHLTGNNNVFLGYRAGFSETGNNKLYISNSSTTTPLIYGDFDKKTLTINDTLVVKGRLSMVNSNLNIFIGEYTGKGITTGLRNNAIGFSALSNNSTGSQNVAFGTDALQFNLSGNNNTAIGDFALKQGTNVSGTVAVGTSAGFNATGADNVFIGLNAGYNETGSNKLCIDNTTTSSPLLYGEFEKNRLTINDTLVAERFYMTENAVDGYVLKSNASGKASWVDPSTLNSSVWSITGNDIYKNTPGNVGIGTSTPSEAIDVIGNIEINGGSLSMVNANNNVSVGQYAGAANTTGLYNNAIGYQAMSNTTTGQYNTAVGAFALESNITGTNNVAIGLGALEQATEVVQNVAVGAQAGKSASGISNIFVGYKAGEFSTTAAENTVVGAWSFVNNLSGTRNVAVGLGTMFGHSGGDNNTALGYGAFSISGSGSNTTAIGYNSLLSNSGSNNTALGFESGKNNLTGSGNTFLGLSAGLNNIGSNNVFIGNLSGSNETGSDKLYIENTASATPLIYGDFAENNVGVNTSTPSSSFEVIGTMGAKMVNNQIAGTNNPDENGMIWRYTSGTGIIVLPDANTCTNRMYVIINSTGGNRNIFPVFTNLNNTGAGIINSATSITLISDGSGWFQVK